MRVKSESEVAQSCPTLSNPMDCSPPGTSVHGIFQARVLERGAVAFSANDAVPLKRELTFRERLQCYRHRSTRSMWVGTFDPHKKPVL